MTQNDLNQILAAHPSLNAFGFDGGHRPPQLDHFQRAIAWLSPFEKTKTIRPKTCSYGLKHRMERTTGHYITNGAFIAAAIYLGFNFEQDGPNAFFNLRLA